MVVVVKYHWYVVVVVNVLPWYDFVVVGNLGLQKIKYVRKSFGESRPHSTQ